MPEPVPRGRLRGLRLWLLWVGAATVSLLVFGFAMWTMVSNVRTFRDQVLEDIAKRSIAALPTEVPVPPRGTGGPRPLRILWEFTGPRAFSSLAVMDRREDREAVLVLACDVEGVLHVLDSKGAEVRAVSLGYRDPVIAVGHFAGRAVAGVAVAGGNRGRTVSTGDVLGRELWSARIWNCSPQSIGCCDVDGDGEDEVFVGGLEGRMHLLSPRGKMLRSWAFGGPVNRVTAGRVGRESRVCLLVLAGTHDAPHLTTVTDPVGRSRIVRVLEREDTLDVWCGNLSGGGTDEVVAIVRNSKQTQSLVCTTATGVERWRAFLGPSDRVTERQRLCAGDFDSDEHTDIAVIGGDSIIHIFDSRGNLVTRYSLGVLVNSICAVPTREGQQFLVVTSIDRCIGLRLTGVQRPRQFASEARTRGTWSETKQRVAPTASTVPDGGP